MASNNYTSANIVPSSDTFREWVDLTNRITYDMEKVVVTVTANSQGAHTAGNGYVNGSFSANTLEVTSTAHANGDLEVGKHGILQGTKANTTHYGGNAVPANLHITSNAVFVSNSSVDSLIHAESNVHLTGTTVESSANVIINSTATAFTSNAATNIFNTKIDANANVDIDNALTDITSTNLAITGTETNIDANTVFTANVNIHSDTADFNIGADEVIVNSSATLFQSNAATNRFNTIVDANANVDIDNALTDITSTNLAITGTETNIDSNTVFTANVNITADAADFNIHADEVVISSSATKFQSDAVTNILNSNTDINANVDIDAASVTIDGGTLTVGSLLDQNANVDIDTALVDIAGGNVTMSSNLLITGVNTSIGDANTDVMTVNANTFLTDKLDVAKAVNLQSDLTVATTTTLNGNVNLGDSVNADKLAVNSKITTNIIPNANGSLGIGNTTLRFDGTFDDLVGEDITANNDLTVTADATVGANLDVNGQFSVATSSLDTIRTTVTGAGSNVRTITLGDAANTNFDRLVIKSGVGTSTFGLQPLHGNNILLGNSTNRWIFSANTIDASGAAEIDGDVTAGANLAVAGESKAATLNITSTSAMGGLLTISSGGADITGSLDLVNNANVGGNAAIVGVLAVTNTAALGNTTVTGFVNATTSGQVGTTLTVGGNSSIGGNLAVSGLSTLTGNTTLSGDLSVAGNTTLTEVATMNANVSLGGATTDVVSYTGRVNTSLEPSASGKVLGHASRRWAAALTTANTSGDITAGGDVDITGEVNAASGAIVGDLSVGDDITLAPTSNVIFSNTGLSTSKVEISGNNISVPYLQVQNQVTLPTDTIITASSFDSGNATITNNLTLTGATAGAANSIFKIGNGANTVNIEFANAAANGHLLAKTTNTSDIGSAAKSFRSGYFDTSVVVGDTVANTTALLANNVYATDDLVAAYSSDQQLKDNVLKIDTALDKVEALGGYSFTWNNNIEDHRAGTPDYGVIAQELEDVLPHAVDINSRGYKTVNYNSLIPLLIEAVKELSARVKELEPEQEEEE